MNNPTLNPYLHNPHLPGSAFCMDASGMDAAGMNAALLFHGFTATCSEVYELGQRLHAAGITAAAPLLPGHGTRPEDLNRTRWQDWVAAAEDAYTQLAAGHRRVFVAGESNGGLLALYLAAKHPEIAAVMAFAPALRLPLTPFQRLQLRVLSPFVPALPKGDLREDFVWQGYTVNPLRAVLQLIRLQAVVLPLLPAIRQPLLIVQGRRDRTIDPRSSEIVYEQAGSALKSLHWLEESGHCVLLDKQREETFRLALDFLAGLPRP